MLQKENCWALLQKGPSPTLLRKEIANRNLALLYIKAQLHKQAVCGTALGLPSMTVG